MALTINGQNQLLGRVQWNGRAVRMHWVRSRILRSNDPLPLRPGALETPLGQFVAGFDGIIQEGKAGKHGKRWELIPVKTRALPWAETKVFGLRGPESAEEAQEAVIGRLVTPSQRVFASKYGRDHYAIIEALMFLGCGRVPEFNNVIRNTGDWQNPTQLDLSGLEFDPRFTLRAANLAGANLRGATLAMVKCRRINLRKADLRGANLLGTLLTQAFLEGANFLDAETETARFYGATGLRKVIAGDLEAVLPTGEQ